MMQVVLYARTSCHAKSDEPEQNISITAQLNQMRKFAESNGWQVYREFSDTAISGRSDQRPGFQEIVQLATQQQEIFHAVLVWRFSRFARNCYDAMLYKKILANHGIEVISVSESSQDPLARISEVVLDAAADIYCHMIATDTKMVMRERALQGYSNGGKVPLGYHRTFFANGKAKLQPDPIYAPIVEKIFTLYNQGHSVNKIIQLFEKEKIRLPNNRHWSYSKIYRILKNQVYTGTVLWGKNNNPVCIPEAHTAVVSAEIFKEVQTRMRRNKN